MDRLGRGSRAFRKIARCSASAEMPFLAARTFSARTTRGSRSRTMSWALRELISMISAGRRLSSDMPGYRSPPRNVASFFHNSNRPRGLLFSRCFWLKPMQRRPSRPCAPNRTSAPQTPRSSPKASSCRMTVGPRKGGRYRLPQARRLARAASRGPHRLQQRRQPR